MNVNPVFVLKQCGQSHVRTEAMNNSNEIGIFDNQITEILEFHKGNAAAALFERYRIPGTNRDSFVAALVGRLCLLESRSLISQNLGGDSA